MKQILTILFLLLQSFAFSQDKSIPLIYTYEGNMKTNEKKKIPISLRFSMLPDSSLRGSYYYQKSKDSLRLYGKLRKDNFFHFTETDLKDGITAYFTGTISIDKKQMSGKWVSQKTDEVRHFKLTQVRKKKHKNN